MKPPEEFLEYHRKLLGREYKDFMEYFTRPLERKSVRVNTLKCDTYAVKEILGRYHLEYGKIPWCSEGLWVSEGKLDTMEHQLGFYYIQSPVSMIPSVLLNPGDGDRVLDLCASPGSKTTHMAALMENKGLLVANEPNFVRIRALVLNIQRCGVMNAVVTKKDGCSYSKLKQTFTKILVDAPCSDVGTARKNPEALRLWSRERIRRLSNLQKKLVSEAYRMLEPGGTLVYSTCTTSLEENEQVVEHLLSTFDDAKIAEAKLPGLEYMHGLTSKTRNCMRILPQHNNTESYFTAKVVKNAQ